MHQELSEDGFFRRVQLDTALKALYTSSEGLSHTVEGDREEGGDRSDAMDIAEPSAHAQARIRRVIDVRLHLYYFLSVIVFAQFTHRDFLSLLDPPLDPPPLDPPPLDPPPLDPPPLDSTSLSFLCRMIISRSKMKGQSATSLGSTMMVGGKNIS